MAATAELEGGGCKCADSRARLCAATPSDPRQHPMAVRHLSAPVPVSVIQSDWEEEGGGYLSEQPWNDRKNGVEDFSARDPPPP